MAYTKTDWQDLPSKATLVTAARLNNMEQGIYDANQPATTSTQGQMSAQDKVKLNALEQAEVSGTMLIV